MTFFATQPQGWRAIQVAVQKITYHVRQAGTSAKLREADFAVRMMTPGFNAELERARYEAMAIQSEIRESLDRKAG